MRKKNTVNLSDWRKKRLRIILIAYVFVFVCLFDLIFRPVVCVFLCAVQLVGGFCLDYALLLVVRDKMPAVKVLQRHTPYRKNIVWKNLAV